MTKLEKLKAKLDAADKAVDVAAEVEVKAREKMIAANSRYTDADRALSVSILAYRQIESQYKALKNA